MKHQSIDINVDVGEGIGNELQLMPFISSCNIACGGHAGDTKSMRAVVKLAKQYGVKIGAHPSFPDKKNFGRKPINLSYTALFSSIKSQIKNLMNILYEENGTLHHVKPHGALYNLAAVDIKIATVIVDVIKSMSIPVKLYAPYKSVIASLAIQNKIHVFYEGFADRNYNDDGTLISRTQKGALIHNADVMIEHVYKMVSTQKVKALNGLEVKIKADTFCVHGDHPEAVNVIKSLKMNLEKKGVMTL